MTDVEADIDVFIKNKVETDDKKFIGEDLSIVWETPELPFVCGSNIQ